jgi:superfamily I DNA/RNA helicase
MSKEKAPQCPQCSSRMVRRNGRRGPFWGCSRYSVGCRGTRDIIDYPEINPADLAPGNPEQHDIWNFLLNDTANGIVNARAGSGKTYTITNGIYRLRGVKIAVFSFNNHIIKEMNKQLQEKNITWVRGYTYNAFGFRAVKYVYPSVELYEDKLDDIIRELHPDESEEGVVIRMALARLSRLCKCYMEDGKDQGVLEDLMDRFNIDLSTAGDFDEDAYERRAEQTYKLVPTVLDACLNHRTIMDFDDQVWWTVKLKLPVERFDVCLVDEAQDTNRMQQELIQMACPD